MKSNTHFARDEQKISDQRSRAEAIRGKKIISCSSLRFDIFRSLISLSFHFFTRKARFSIGTTHSTIKLAIYLDTILYFFPSSLDYLFFYFKINVFYFFLTVILSNIYALSFSLQGKTKLNIYLKNLQ